MTKSKLVDLLEETFGSDENPWISNARIDLALLKVSNGKGVPLAAIQDIYWRRGRRNRLRGYPIEGFEVFLWNLKTTNTQTVLVHNLIDRAKREYAVFTDPELTQLIGLLRFPKKES